MVRETGRLNGVDKDIIDAAIPPTVDELEAYEENKNLDKNVKEEVLATDDHLIHVEIHREAAETPAKFAHIEAHKKAMSIKKTSPEMFPSVPSEQMPSEDVMSKLSKAPGEGVGANAGRGFVPGR